MSPRKRNETIGLAILAIVSVVPLRIFVESRGWFLTEMGMIVGVFAVAEVARNFGIKNRGTPKGMVVFATALLVTTPMIVAVVARAFGSPIAFEMSGLTAFGTASLAIAISAHRNRTRAMSLVISGFLVLFSTSISDDPRAVWLAVLWMTVCVWHLVANHWERIDLCLPDSVRPTIGVRPASVLIAVALCIIGGLVVQDRFSQHQRLSFGIMPTSGGSKWSDPAARSGVGTGDAVIAAKDHAESFGAVDSEIFLESTEPTLFDMFSDSIGEPKKKKKWERSQAMGNEKVIPMHERVAKSEKGGSSFSTDRLPPKKHRHFDDAVEAAVVQWDGPTGIRLAMQRYDTFDGVDWTNRASLANDALQRNEIDKHVWFFDSKLRSKAFQEADALEVNLLKVLRLDTTRLPAPMMTAGLHIKDVDRQDFFGIDDDGSLYMPGRDKVPPMTVVHLASLKVMEDELLMLSAYEQLQSIVHDLRNEFTLDRNATSTTDDPVAEFLRTGRGGDHLFATVAALRAREIGLQSRVVTGFYVRPDSYDIAAGHASVTADDVHVWTEIRLDDGRWFEIEPTPGYRKPVYAPSTWLVAKRFVAAHWLHGLSIVGAFGLLFVTRLIWIEWLLAAGWSLSWPLGRQRQLRLAMKIVETRAKLIGKQRPLGIPQRDWLESLVASDAILRDRVRKFCNDADKSIFGGTHVIDRGCLSGVVHGLSARRLKMASAKVAT
ncbi:MAG: transglutaminase domain-containing protein [Rubripirellula sp.]